ncbi:MAG: DEAD/DEAH box helicase [Treponema sp.]|nr:DEAD/DEAH box helicase [Treponema sp.]
MTIDEKTNNDELFDSDEIIPIEDDVIENDDSESEEDGPVTFEDLGLDERALAAVRRKGFEFPSPIQVLAIPRLLNGDSNVIARARTGTGKTAAFGLPIIQQLRDKSDYPQALILEPTRELAMQTCTEMQSFTEGGYPRTCVLYGGASYSGQIKDLRRGCEIVVGTPGRIQDHLERKTLDISKIKYFILDEGDEMLDMGFIDDIEHIFEQANPDARILLFSATMPEPILKIAQKFMGEYEIMEEEGVVDEPLLIDQKFWVLRESDKIEALVRLIDMAPDFYGLVFTMTKNDADNVTRALDLRGYEAAALHGDIMQNQREKVLERFRSKKTRILVATDVAARGIDISGLTHVVNYSIPFDGATYVHRIGRTGRAGSSGTAVTFVRPEERRKLSFLQRAVAKASKGQMVEEEVPTVHDVLEAKRIRIVDELVRKVWGTSEKTEEKPEKSEEIAENTENSLGNVEIVQNGASEAVESSPVEVDSFFTELAEKLINGGDAKAVLAAVLADEFGEKLSPKHYGRISNPKKMGRSFEADPNSTRIFVSLGKKDHMGPRDIADFFSNLLHIPNHKVDNIDMAREFSLVSLPKESAKKALEMAQRNKNLPHMHIDTKGEPDRSPRRRGAFRDRPEGIGERRDGEGRRSRDGAEGRRERRFDDRKREEGRKGDRDGQRREGRSKGNRPNTHTQSTRNAASLYKKSSSSGKAERF